MKTPTVPVDLDDAEAAILHSMTSGDQQSRAEYSRAYAALRGLIVELLASRTPAEAGALRCANCNHDSASHEPDGCWAEGGCKCPGWAMPVPVEAGAVTREHCEMARIVVAGYGLQRQLADSIGVSVARAICDAEARGRGAARTPPAEPVPMLLYCPVCSTLHVDDGMWATRPHKTHLCQSCNHEWRPFAYPTVGVQEAPSAPADHEPFSPMACCGRERDKDGAPNPHCECPAPVVAHPTFGELTAEVERLRAEVQRLNPFAMICDGEPPPKEQPANFISGVRYYLGMLEDDGDWSHELGHIESLCAEFQRGIDTRAGKPAAPPQEPPARAVVVGSVWRTPNGGLRVVTELSKEHGVRGRFVGAPETTKGPWFQLEVFLRLHTWVSDRQEGERES